MKSQKAQDAGKDTNVKVLKSILLAKNECLIVLKGNPKENKNEN
tara:strand:- start:64 stop:195 length:132 start_codon:yes stop_codon:yes gene_type:complete